MRLTGGGEVDVDCPVCGLPLPPIVLEYDMRGAGPRSLTVEIRQPVLSDGWWRQVWATHPDCPNPDAPRPA